MGEKTCETCRFSLMAVAGDPNHGFCRRYPPKMLLAEDTVWPEISSVDWCGEHQPSTKDTDNE